MVVQFLLLVGGTVIIGAIAGLIFSEIEARRKRNGLD